MDDAVLVDGDPVVPYTHFSLTMSASRRLARWVAWNVDGTAMRRLVRSNDFRLDPRVPADAQVGEELYADNRLDRGHLARRADLTWGAAAEAARANTDSFFFTNIAPQIDSFNQASRWGVWGRLEDALYEAVTVDRLRISVFGGPVLRDDDLVYRGVLVPREFWKVIAWEEEGALTARGSCSPRTSTRSRRSTSAEFETYQVPLADLAERTGVVLDPALPPVRRPPPSRWCRTSSPRRRTSSGEARAGDFPVDEASRLEPPGGREGLLDCVPVAAGEVGHDHHVLLEPARHAEGPREVTHQVVARVERRTDDHRPVIELPGDPAAVAAPLEQAVPGALAHAVQARRELGQVAHLHQPMVPCGTPAGLSFLSWSWSTWRDRSRPQLVPGRTA